MSTSSYDRLIDYSKGSFSSFIPTDINQGWVIDPALLTRNIQYISSVLSFSDEVLETKFYDLVTKLFSDVNYLQALQTEYLKLPVGTVTLTNIDNYVESLYQAIILYAVIEEFDLSLLNNVSGTAEEQILQILNLVITSGFQTKIDTAFTTMDFSRLSNATIDQFVTDIYNSIGTTPIPRDPSFEFKAGTPLALTIEINSGIVKYLDLFDIIQTINPSDLQNVKASFTYNETDDPFIGYVRSDWSFTRNLPIIEKDFTLYTDAGGNNTAAAIQILPGTQISFSKHIPGSNLFTVTSNRIKTHPPAKLVCTFTDNNYVDDTIKDTTGKILGKRSIEIIVKYKDPTTVVNTGFSYKDIIIPIDTKTWAYDQIIPITFERELFTPATIKLPNLINSVITNLTDIGTVRLASDNFGIDFIPNAGIDLQTALPGKYFEFDWTESGTSYMQTGHNRYTFKSRLSPDTTKAPSLEVIGSNYKQAKTDSYYAGEYLNNMINWLVLTDETDEYDMDYIFTIDKSISDVSWTLTYLNGVYIFDNPKCTIKIRRSLSFSNNFEFYHTFKGLSTLADYNNSDIQALPLTINVTAIDTAKYIDDNTLDYASKIYGKRTIKFQPVTHYRGVDYPNFSAPASFEVRLDRKFVGFKLPAGDGNSAIQYLTAKYLIDPTKKDNIKVTLTVISTTLPASQVVQVTEDKVYFNSIDTLASPLDRTSLDATTLAYLDAGQLSELGALYSGKEVKIRIQINDKVNNNVFLDTIQTIKFIPYSITW